MMPCARLVLSAALAIASLLSAAPAATFFSPSTSLICRWEMTVPGSFGSRIRPGTSLMNTRRLALSAIATWAAATSALQL
jgi:hypothetical protein